MKIAMLSRYPPAQDGIGIYTKELIAQMQAEVITIGDAGSDADYIVDFSSYHLKESLARIITKEGIELLHVQYIAAYFSKPLLNYNLLRALGQKIPVVATLHEVHYYRNSPRDILLSLLEQEVTRRAGAVVVHTTEQARVMRKRSGGRHVAAIPMGLTPHTPRKRAGKKLLAFGLINKGKGTLEAVRAMADLPEFTLTVAGKAVHEEYAKQVHEAAQGKKNVTLRLGWISDAEVEALIAGHDAMLLAYSWAPYQSAAMHRAFSYGLPVVVTRAGAIHEVVEEYNAGVVIDSAAGLAKGVRELFSLYKEKQQGVLTYQKKANWKSVAAAHEELYRQILKKQK